MRCRVLPLRTSRLRVLEGSSPRVHSAQQWFPTRRHCRTCLKAVGHFVPHAGVLSESPGSATDARVLPGALKFAARIPAFRRVIPHASSRDARVSPGRLRAELGSVIPAAQHPALCVDDACLHGAKHKVSACGTARVGMRRLNRRPFFHFKMHFFFCFFWPSFWGQKKRQL